MNRGFGRETIMPLAYKDKEGYWQMPAPERIARHFNSAATKAKYHRIVADLPENLSDEEYEQNKRAAFEACTHPVPVFKGVDKATFAYFMRQAVKEQARQAEQNNIHVDDEELTR